MLNSYVPGFNPYLMQSMAAPMGYAPELGVGDVMQPMQPLGTQSLPAPQPTATQPYGALMMPNNRLGQLMQQPSASVYSRPSLNPSLDFVNNGGQQGYYFVTNKGRAAKTKASRSGFIPVNENWQYRIWNERGPNSILSSGTGAQGLQDVYKLAQQLSAEQGKKADWKVEVFDPTVGRWVTYADDDPKKGFLGGLGKVLGTALPIAVSLIPGLQFAGPVASAALAGGAGAALAGRDPLKGAIMSGLTAGGGQLMGGTLGASLGIPQALGISRPLAGAIGTGLGATAGGLATGQNLQNSLLGGVTSGALSYLTPQLLGELGVSPGDATSGAGGDTGGALDGSLIDGGNIVVPGNLNAPLTSINVPSNLLGSTGGSGTPDSGIDGNPITVLGNNPPVTSIPINTGGLGGTGGETAAPPENEIVVTAPEPTPSVPIDTGGLGGTGDYEQSPGGEPIVVEGTPPPGEMPSVPIPIPNVTPPSQVDAPDVEAPDENSTLDDIINYLRAAGLLSGFLGDVFGGGGGNRVGRIPGGLSSGYNPVFSAQLPSSSKGLPTPRTAADIAPRGNEDWYRYGYGPERSFFSNVPQGAPNTSTAYTGYAMGGEVDSFAVRGRGDGRSDDVPAMLSDGEYVMDAETVALLGNGSNEAGAEMLDQFRVNLRKHKGRSLAKGDFSVKAKRPEQYMYGGRA